MAIECNNAKILDDVLDNELDTNSEHSPEPDLGGSIKDPEHVSRLHFCNLDEELEKPGQEEEDLQDYVFIGNNYFKRKSSEDIDIEMRTSQTHPLDVDFITVFPKITKESQNSIPPGKLGMCSAPGKHTANKHYVWQRSMQDDIKYLKEVHNIDVLISLMMPEEYKTLQMTSLSSTCLEYDIQPIFFPIQDRYTPYLYQYAKYKMLIKNIVRMVQKENKTVMVHCRRGRGRTGLVVACCLVYAGMTPNKAIKHCRKCREGTISNIKQEEYIIDFFESIIRERSIKHTLQKRTMAKDLLEEKELEKTMNEDTSTTDDITETITDEEEVETQSPEEEAETCSTEGGESPACTTEICMVNQNILTSYMTPPIVIEENTDQNEPKD